MSIKRRWNFMNSEINMLFRGKPVNGSPVLFILMIFLFITEKQYKNLENESDSQ